jgi:hypothetical protein
MTHNEPLPVRQVQGPVAFKRRTSETSRKSPREGTARCRDDDDNDKGRCQEQPPDAGLHSPPLRSVAAPFPVPS